MQNTCCSQANDLDAIGVKELHKRELMGLLETQPRSGENSIEQLD